MKQLLLDGSAGDLVVIKELSLNLDFIFLNRISQLLISCNYPIVLTRLDGPRFRSYIPRKKIRAYPGTEPWISGIVVSHAKHYPTEAFHNYCIRSKKISRGEVLYFLWEVLGTTLLPEAINYSNIPFNTVQFDFETNHNRRQLG